MVTFGSWLLTKSQKAAPGQESQKIWNAASCISNVCNYKMWAEAAYT